jgi:hypothetical protein
MNILFSHEYIFLINLGHLSSTNNSIPSAN